ncbi:MAG TPA: PAS domain S-box protein [Bacteroidetes bacterium]|nr:PAS domain S-box protein [Bacteroidota bacterium]
MKNKTKAQLIDKIRRLEKRVNDFQKSEIISKQMLKDSDIEYRTLVENVMDGIYIISLKGFEYVNPAFEQILGYKAKEIYNKDWFNIFFKPELVDEMNSIWSSAWGAKSHSYNNPILNKAGEERIISWQTSGFYEEEDEKKHLLL